ncbi:hypothetical protein AWV80_19800 [Cupriavidus sp. UYMU48A]|nr:hypothetical protein AWV80_19800 [Cupriavidus sp. UYMU48A]
MLESPTTIQSPPRRSAAAAPAPAKTAVVPGGWAVLFVLTLVYIVSFIDRGAISLVVGPIKQDLGATDLEVSWLLGLSFMLLYSVLGIPAGYLVDLYRRKYLLSGAILMWSGVQMLCGLSNTYWHLFLARIGLGAGRRCCAGGFVDDPRRLSAGAARARVRHLQHRAAARQRAGAGAWQLPADVRGERQAGGRAAAG